MTVKNSAKIGVLRKIEVFYLSNTLFYIKNISGMLPGCHFFFHLTYHRNNIMK